MHTHKERDSEARKGFFKVLDQDVKTFNPEDDDFNDAVEGDICAVCEDYQLSHSQKVAALTSILVFDAVTDPVAALLTVIAITQSLKLINKNIAEQAVELLGFDEATKIEKILNAEAAAALVA